MGKPGEGGRQMRIKGQWGIAAQGAARGELALFHDKGAVLQSPNDNIGLPRFAFGPVVTGVQLG